MADTIAPDRGMNVVYILAKNESRTLIFGAESELAATATTVAKGEHLKLHCTMTGNNYSP